MGCRQNHVCKTKGCRGPFEQPNAQWDDREMTRIGAKRQYEETHMAVEAIICEVLKLCNGLWVSVPDKLKGWTV